MDGVTDWNEVHGRIVASVMQEGKHQQLLDHSANVTRGQLNAMKNGGWVGSPPFAYRIEGQRKHKGLVVDDPGKVRVVQRIFREFVEERRSLRNIAERLNAEELVPPSGKVNGWRWDTVRIILENPVYTGDYKAGRYGHGKYSRIKGDRVEKSNGVGRVAKPEAEWIVHPNHHQALISPDTFDRAQSLFAEGKTGRSPYTPEEIPTSSQTFSVAVGVGAGCGVFLVGRETRPGTMNVVTGNTARTTRSANARGRRFGKMHF
ncbi:MAG: recombinase family protein [Gemmataceae bacterium]